MSTEKVLLPEPGEEPSPLIRRILCNFGLQCTVEEVAADLGIGCDDLDEVCTRELGGPAWMVRDVEIRRGRVELRKMLWEMVPKNPTMAIFLAKNYLGMVNDGGHTADRPVIIDDVSGLPRDDVDEAI